MATMKEIAELCNISRGTVDRVQAIRSLVQEGIHGLILSPYNSPAIAREIASSATGESPLSPQIQTYPPNALLTPTAIISFRGRPRLAYWDA